MKDATKRIRPMTTMKAMGTRSYFAAALVLTLANVQPVSSQTNGGGFVWKNGFLEKEYSVSMKEFYTARAAIFVKCLPIEQIELTMLDGKKADILALGIGDKNGNYRSSGVIGLTMSGLSTISELNVQDGGIRVDVKTMNNTNSITVGFKVGDGDKTSSEVLHKLLAATLAAPGEAIEALFVTETRLTQIGSGMVAESLVVSPDTRHVAYALQRGGRVFVAVDGIESKAYEDLVNIPIEFSADGKHMAYGVWRGNKCMVVLDGTEGREYDSIGEDGIALSPNGSRMAYNARRRGRWVVVLDGEESEEYDGVGSLVFDGASKNRVAYVASKKGVFVVVVDGKESPGYDGIGKQGLLFSSDGKRIAYAARKGNDWTVVVDGKEGSSYDGVGRIMWSPDGKRLAFVAQKNGRMRVVVDGQEGKEHEGVSESSLTFSADGTQFSYTTGARDGGRTVVVNGIETALTGGVSGFVFSPNGKRSVYVLHESGMSTVVEAGRKSEMFDAVIEGTPIFSPNGQKMTFGARKADKWFMVADGKKGKAYDALAGGSLVVFDPSGDHLAYVAQKGRQWVLVLDEQEAGEFDGFPRGSRLVFDDPHRLHTLAGRGKELVLVVVDIGKK